MNRRFAAAFTLFILATAVAARGDQGPSPLRLRSATVQDTNKNEEPAADAAARRPAAMLIRLRSTLTPEQRTILLEAGAELLAYVPENAYLARIPASGLDAVRRLDFIAHAGPFRPGWKLAPEITRLRSALAGGARPEDLTQVVQPGGPRVAPQDVTLLRRGRAPLAVATAPGISGAEAAVALRAVAGVEVRGHASLDRGAVVDVVAPLAQLEALAALPEIQFIEPAPRPVLRNSLTVTTIQSDTDTQTPVWDRGLHGEGEIIGLIDGPMITTHCMFADTEAIGPLHRKLVAWRVNPPYTLNTHGSHVAGTLAGDSGSRGVYDANDGVAFASRLSFSNYFAVDADPPSIKLRLIDAHNDGARVHSNSYGDDATTAYTTWCALLDDFCHVYEEDLVVFAASNAGTVRTPENAKNVLAVAATWRYPNQNYQYSGGYGPTADGRRKPEICAPGQNVRSASLTACSTTLSSGTSHACPAVAGAAALVRQYFREGYYAGGDLSSAILIPSGALLKAVLLNATVDLEGVEGYPSDAEGWGRLVLDDGLYFVGDTRRMLVRDVRNGDGLTTGQVDRFTMVVDDAGASLKVTMVYTDPPATVGAADPVVNDLDLVLIGPETGIAGGNIFRGNHFKIGQSAAGGVADPRNNVEQVYLPTPPVGTYTVEVHGTAVNGLGPQGFAVVATGAVQSGAETSAGSGDADGDGDIDLADFARLQVCYAGDGMAFADARCAALDSDADGDVDLVDVIAFEWQLLGPTPPHQAP